MVSKIWKNDNTIKARWLSLSRMFPSASPIQHRRTTTPPVPYPHANRLESLGLVQQLHRVFPYEDFLYWATYNITVQNDEPAGGATFFLLLLLLYTRMQPHEGGLHCYIWDDSRDWTFGYEVLNRRAGNLGACFGEKGNLGTCSNGAALQGKSTQHNVHSIDIGPFWLTVCIAALNGRVGR